MSDVISTLEAFGHEADLFNTIKEIGWTDTPFFASLAAKAPSAKTKSSFGHKWNYLPVPDGADNAHLEGSAPAAAAKYLM